MGDLSLERRRELLAAFVRSRKAAEEAGGAEMFLGTPDRWYRDPGPRWRCPDGHVSTFVLKCEERGDCCLAAGCGEPVWLTFPEDRDGPLPLAAAIAASEVTRG